MKKWIIALTTCLFFLLVTSIILFTLPYIKRTLDDTQNMELFDPSDTNVWCRNSYSIPGTQYSKRQSNCEHVGLLLSASQITLRLFELIRHAEKSIILSTYRWRA